MTRLVLVRHGETEWHRENRYAGSSEVALTALGRSQAGDLARWAATAALTALWCSPLSRARETAAPVAVATGLRSRCDERLREVGFGQGEGLTGAEMAERFPAERAAFQTDPVGCPLPGGEDPRAAVERARRCLAEITAEFPTGRVLVVAHSTLIRLLLCDLLGLDLSAYRRVFPSLLNVAVNEVRLVDGAAALLRFNHPVPRNGESAT